MKVMKRDLWGHITHLTNKGYGTHYLIREYAGNVGL